MKTTMNMKIWKMMSLLLLGMFVFTGCDPEAWLPEDPFNPDNPDKPDIPVVDGAWTKPIDEAVVWDGDLTVKGTVYVNAELTIKPGAVITFHENAQLYVQNEGVIKAEGLADKPIIFKAHEKDADWNRIYIVENAGKSTKFAYCHFSGAEIAIEVYKNKVSVDNCVIKDCSVNGVKLSHDASEFGSFTANTISDCEGYPLVIPVLQATAVTSDNEISGTGILITSHEVNKSNAKVTVHEQTIPYVIGSSYLTIDDNAEVTIEPGVTIAMSESSYISVGYYSSGKLTAVGTEEKPITFTSNAKDKAAGDWGGIRFYEYASKSSALKYCNIEYSGEDYGGVYIYKTAIAIENSTITNNNNHGVNANSNATFTSFAGNVIKDNELSPVACSAAAAGVIAADNELDALGVDINSYKLGEKVTWVNLNVPYTVRTSYLEIDDGGSLTIEPGTTVQFSENSYMSIGYYSEGKLVAVGTEEEPITFTSAMNDKYPGDWGGIYFYEYAGGGSILDHCKILYGGDYGYSLYIYDCDAKVTVQNCEIGYSDGYGIRVNDASPTLSNNTYHDNKDGNNINGAEYTDAEM